MGPSQATNLRPVRIDWEGPLSLPEALQKNDDEPNGKDYGVYLIEGHNILYGCTGGLYFGIARDQTYATRMAQHGCWLEYEQDVQIRLGRLRDADYKHEPPDWPDWYKLLG